MAGALYMFAYWMSSSMHACMHGFMCADLQGSREDGEAVGEACFKVLVCLQVALCQHGWSDHSPPLLLPGLALFVSLVYLKKSIRIAF